VNRWRTVPLFGIGVILMALAFFAHIYVGMGCGLVLILASFFFTLSVKKGDK